MNYFEQMRNKYFSHPLHKFNYKKCYTDIVRHCYSSQHCQSVQDLDSVIDFCNRHCCIYWLSANENGLGATAVIYQQPEGGTMFSVILFNRDSLSFAACNN